MLIGQSQEPLEWDIGEMGQANQALPESERDICIQERIIYTSKIVHAFTSQHSTLITGTGVSGTLYSSVAYTGSHCYTCSFCIL